jgi:hypothetical protein
MAALVSAAVMKVKGLRGMLLLLRSGHFMRPKPGTAPRTWNKP